MSLKWLDGFETSRADADLRTRGYMYTAATPTALPSSATGVAGFGVSQIAAAVTVHTTTPFGGVNSPMGYWTGFTVNQAWLAGGFTVGVSATSNLASVTGKFYGYAMGSGATTNPNAMCFDGSLYWSIGVNASSTYNIFTSPDLINWTPVPSLPTALGPDATVSYMGGGMIAVGVAAATNAIIYYTTNNGASWSNQVLGTNGSNTFRTIAAQTGNSSFPHVVISSGVWNQGLSGNYQLFIAVGTIGGTLTNVVNGTNVNNGVPSGTNSIGSVQTFGGAGGVIASLKATGTTGATTGAIDFAPVATINTSANWIRCTLGTIVPNDIIFSATSNSYVLATLTGISTFPNGTGTAGVPNIPAAGALTLTSRYSTTGMQKIFLVGSTLVSVGQLGHIITSTDGGVTWTEAGQKVLPVGTAGFHYTCALYDGSKYVVATDSGTGLINTTTDLVNNWQTLYANHKAVSASFSTDVNGIGMIATSTTTKPAIPSANNVITPLSGSNMYNFAPSAVTAAGLLQCFLVKNVPGTGTTAISTITVASNVSTPQQATHYYEIVYTSGATANTFVVTMNIDGAQVFTSGTAQAFAGTGDTTSQMFFLPLPSTQTVAQCDDFYFCLNDGTGVSGAQGTVNVVAQRPTTDVSTQWSKTGSAVSNALSVNQSAPSSQSTNFVSSNTPGDKDVYSSSGTLPAGFTPKAIVNEAFFTKTSSTTPTVQIGTVSGATESDSAAVSLPTQGVQQLVTQVVEKDPNGNIAWTSASINAAKFAIIHTT